MSVRTSKYSLFLWKLGQIKSSFKFGWLRKWFGTLFINKWLLSWMGSEVCLKIVWRWESPWTIFTNEWFLSWMCLLRLPESENDLKHSLQVNGLSPEWVLRWVLSSDDWENDLEHSLQVYGFSPEWVLRWVLSSCSNVFIKIAWIGKWFKTFFTSKWLLSRMGS